MRELKGKAAFVTGGASGIGLAMARAFLQSGMKVMIADIERDALDRALGELRPLGEVRGLICDVAERQSVFDAAKASFDAFGRVHVLCNNAGVGAGGPQEQISAGDWDWVLDVNLHGVVHGTRAFLPHIKAHGEGGHVVNTASMAGHLSVPGMGPYCATKFAVVAMSEGLAGELQGSSVGVSVLCPGWVRTSITESSRNRPERFGERSNFPPHPMAAMAAEAVRNGLDPNEVAAQVVDAIRENHLYIFTHPEMRAAVDERHGRIRAAFDRAEQAKQKRAAE
jgi:NAD(P)-dependent dehydrogenase (short-subunit alcohol dehydrogenase family)